MIVRYAINSALDEEMAADSTVIVTLEGIFRQLLNPHFSFASKLIETEKLLAELVEAEMNKRQKEGSYKGKKFNAICHFFGYHARGSLPSKFDCDYAYVLSLNGYMATVTNLKNPSNKWRCGAAPITAMLSIKHDSGGSRAMTIGKPLVHPAAVDLRGKVYEFQGGFKGWFQGNALYACFLQGSSCR